MKKYICLVVVSIVMVFGMQPIVASAAVKSTPNCGVKAKYYNSVSASVGVSSGKVVCRSVVNGKSGKTTKISTSIYMQKYNNGSWSNYKSWSGTKSGINYVLCKSSSATKGKKYRTKAVFKIYSGSKYETITKYSGAIKY